MNFQIPAAIVLAGLGVAAAVLYFLQRLRIRQQPLTVETTLFWEQAIEEARARVLVHRFRYPWVYALLLLIASALWLAFARPTIEGVSKRDEVVLIVGSQGTGNAEDLALRVEQAEEYAAALAPSRRTVIFCGVRPRTVLRPSEPLSLLRPRLERLNPESAPGCLDRAIRECVSLRSSSSSEGDGLMITAVGETPVSASLVDALPASVQLSRLSVEDSEGNGDRVNQGILALGASPAVSGLWDRVDVLVEVGATAGEPSVPSIVIDGADWSAAPEMTEVPVDGAAPRSRWLYRDLPASGGLLVASLSQGDASPSDDRAELILPKRHPLRVIVDPDLPQSLLAALAADPGVRITESAPEVAIRHQTSELGLDLPAIELVDRQLQEDAFLINHDGSSDPAEVARDMTQRLGLAEIDAVGMARELGETITLGARPAGLRRMQVWSQLFGDRYNFARSRSFPLFTAMTLRWLANRADWPGTASVSTPVFLGDAQARPIGGAWSSGLTEWYTPTHPGVHETSDGVRFAASVFDEALVAPADSGADLDVASSVAGRPLLVTILMIAAFALLLAEWFLYRAGRIP